MSFITSAYPPPTIFPCYGSYNKDHPECRACQRSQACFVKTNLFDEKLHQKEAKVVRA